MVTKEEIQDNLRSQFKLGLSDDRYYSSPVSNQQSLKELSGPVIGKSEYTLDDINIVYDYTSFKQSFNYQK